MVSKMADGEGEEAPDKKNEIEEDSDEEDINEDEEEDENLDGTEFDDPDGFIDDVSDEELLGDFLKRKPKRLEGTESVIVVDNVPSVGPDRVDKLKNVIGKIFGKFGKIISEFYPNDNGVTKGYVFLEYSNPKDASQAVKTADGYKLDKSHIFAVYHLSDFERFSNLLDDWTEPEKQPFPEQGNLREWLLDPDCNDQYSVVHGSGDNVKVSILLNTATEPIIAKERPNWTDTYVRWSPKGTYLATFHQQGLALWGGIEFKRLQRFSHPSVQLIDFSPCERYLVTFSPLPDDPEDPHGIVIWDIRTGAKKRGFHCGDTSQWPVFKWSHDGKYFARSVDENSISVFETPSFGLLDKKSIKVDGIKEFAWSPGTDMISFWVPEYTDTPARVTIIEIPSRKEISVKNLFNVSECKMYWQSTGDYLCVKVDRYTKSKKGLYYNLEVFCLREKQIPVDIVEVKETINAFAWEPGGSRFCIIHGESPRISASFYIVENSSVTVLKTLDKKQVNNIFWSPNGQFCVLAGLRNMSGVLEFYDSSDATLMNTVEHFMATDVEWDPTGRYVMSSVSWWAHKVDNGYNIWSFQGKALQHHSMEQFCQLLWRPRPPTLLSEDDMKRIKKEIKRYQKMFEVKDRMSQSRASKELIDKRRKMMRDFESYRQKKENEYYQQKQQRLDLRKGMDTDKLDSNADEFEEETVEFFIKEEIIEINKDKE